MSQSLSLAVGLILTAANPVAEDPSDCLVLAGEPISISIQEQTAPVGDHIKWSLQNRCSSDVIAHAQLRPHMQGLPAGVIITTINGPGGQIFQGDWGKPDYSLTAQRISAFDQLDLTVETTVDAASPVLPSGIYTMDIAYDWVIVESSAPDELGATGFGALHLLGLGATLAAVGTVILYRSRRSIQED